MDRSDGSTYSRELLENEPREVELPKGVDKTGPSKAAVRIVMGFTSGLTPRGGKRRPAELGTVTLKFASRITQPGPILTVNSKVVAFQEAFAVLAGSSSRSVKDVPVKSGSTMMNVSPVRMDMRGMNAMVMEDTLPATGKAYEMVVCEKAPTG